MCSENIGLILRTSVLQNTCQWMLLACSSKYANISQIVYECEKCANNKKNVNIKKYTNGKNYTRAKN